MSSSAKPSGRNADRVTLLGILVGFLVGCGTETPPTGGTGGLNGSGGVTGGNPSTGGAPSGGNLTTGGNSSGGAPAAGGTATGGKATGGTSTGGTATGGKATGGASTGVHGGTATGGSGSSNLCPAGITQTITVAKDGSGQSPDGSISHRFDSERQLHAHPHQHQGGHLYGEDHDCQPHQSLPGRRRCDHDHPDL